MSAAPYALEVRQESDPAQQMTPEAMRAALAQAWLPWARAHGWERKLRCASEAGLDPGDGGRIPAALRSNPASGA